MEIHYLWLDEYKNLREQGINLSSKYIFEIQIGSPDSYNRNVAITVKSNPSYIPDFFKKPNLKNVTAIIGKNGAGKSNVLDFIRNSFPEGLSASTSNIIVAYSTNDNNGKETCMILKPVGWTLRLSGEVLGFKVSDYYESLQDGDNFRFTSATSQADYIYYSFFLDYKSEPSDWAGLKNISTSALIEEERKNAISDSLRVDSKVHLDSYSSDLSYFIKNETAKSIQFIISDYAKKFPLPFKKPRSLDVTINETDRKFFMSGQDGSSEDVRNIIKILDEKNKNAQKYDKAINNFCIATFINFMITERKYSSIRFDHDLSIQSNETVKEFVNRFFKTLKDIKVDFGEYKDISVAKYEPLSINAPRLFDLLEQYINEEQIILQDIGNNNYQFRFMLTDKSDERFASFIDLYLRIKRISNFLEFNWRNLSTGEQSFLSFMARFHHLKYHQVGSDLKKSLVILIDEGDAGFHPDWQRKYFKIALDFLCALFTEHNLQLIFTANAPFITSDLTKAHIVFIEKKNGMSVIHKKDNDRQETFGSNIHSLFSDSFYMEGVLMGSFAENRINEIISYLRDTTDIEIDLNIKKTIDVVGEPILKSKLLEMAYEKFGYDDKIAWHKQQIQELEKKRKKDGKNR